MVISVFSGDRNRLLALPPHPSPLPQGGEGEREPICVLFKSCVQLGISSRRNLREQRGQSPLPPREGKGSRFVRFSNLAFNSVFQVGVTCASNAVSPLSLWERGKGADLCAFQILRSTRYFKSAHLVQATRSVPSPPREGKGSRFVRFSNLAFNSVFQVGAPCASNAVSPLSPRERGKGADLCAFQILRSTRYFKSA
jgi:hypothetical protein